MIQAGQLTFRESVAPIFGFVSWVILVLTVQPWSQGGSNAPKALALGIALLLALLTADIDLRLRVPTPVWVLFVYAGLVMTATVGFDSPTAPIIRWVRFLASLLVVILFAGRFRGDDHRLAFWHLAAHVMLGLIVLAGMLLEPGRAFAASVGDDSEGARLVGVFMPLTAPRVGEVAAVATMSAICMWLFGQLRPWVALTIVAMGSLLLIESHTRTAMLSMIIALTAALVSTRQTPGGRRGLRILSAFGALVLLASPYLLGFVMRNQSTKMLFSLTGRTYTWHYIATTQLTGTQRWFGHGLGEFSLLMRRSDNTYGLMPIDNGFVSLYWTCGIVGVTLVALFLTLAWITVLRARPGLNKAIAVALITYVSIACITETGMGDLSSHTLHLLAAVYLAAITRWPDDSGRMIRPASPTLHTEGNVLHA